MKRCDLIIRQRPVVRAVSDPDCDALESFGDTSSPIDVKNLNMLNFLYFHAIYTRNNHFRRDILRSQQGNIPGAVGETGRNSGSKLLPAEFDQFFKIKFETINRFFQAECFLNSGMNFTK